MFFNVCWAFSDFDKAKNQHQHGLDCRIVVINHIVLNSYFWFLWVSHFSCMYLLLWCLWFCYFYCLQPTQQQTRYRKSPYAPSDGEGMPSYWHSKLLGLNVPFASSFSFLVGKMVLNQFNSSFHYVDGGSVQPEDGTANEWETALDLLRTIDCYSNT